MKKALWIMICIAVGSLIWFCGTSWAYRAYVTDTLQITMRSGPSTGHKIIAMLTSGQPVEVLESSGGWSHVRTVVNEGRGKEGWVLTRFLIKRLPWKSQYEAVRQENETLKQTHGDIQQRWQEMNRREQELTQQLEQTTSALEKLQTQYNELRQGAANYLKLKEEFDKTQAALAVAQKTVQKLANENESLKYSQNMKWFAIGVLVPFLGWIVGLLMGRRQRRNRPTLFR